MPVKLIQLSKDLAYRLQDPVSSGTTDGSRLTADNRLGYIIQAYRRFITLVYQLYPELSQQIIDKYALVAEGETDVNGEVPFTSQADPPGINIEQVFEVYVKIPTEEYYTTATELNPWDFLKVELGLNEFYKPDLNTPTYFWSEINGSIKLLPKTLFDIKYTYRRDVASYIELNGYSSDEDIDLNAIYFPVLLDLACSDAYSDIGEFEKSEQYFRRVIGELQILTSKKQEMEKKDENTK